MFEIRELNIAIALWGAAFCLVGIACTLLFSQADRSHRNIFVAGFSCEFAAAFGDAIAGIGRGQATALAWTATHLGNLITFVGSFMLVAVLTLYVCMRIEEASGASYNRLRTIVLAASVIMCMLTALGVFYTIDQNNIYQRTGLYWIAQAFVVAVTIADLAVVVGNRKQLDRMAIACLLFYTLSTLAAAAAQAHVYGLNFTVIVGALNLVIVFFEMQAYEARMLKERTEELADSKVKLADSRIAVMVSQIQPHFLFNSLDTIYGLVDEDPELAKEAVASFSSYLRCNLDSLKRTTPVPIESELEHVRTYLELERMADEDKIMFEIDAQAGGFSVPALSVQPLAENAVKHGIAARENGGHVWVRTREQPGEYTVSVVDDGVGFDPSGLSSESGVGIANTRERLEAMCGGTLEVMSEPGAGTTVVMHIPKEGGVSL